nr:MAG TPA: hypothetical protein [Caudoviricetes sp.]
MLLVLLSQRVSGALALVDLGLVLDNSTISNTGLEDARNLSSRARLLTEVLRKSRGKCIGQLRTNLTLTGQHICLEIGQILLIGKSCLAGLVLRGFLCLIHSGQKSGSLLNHLVIHLAINNCNIKLSSSHFLSPSRRYGRTRHLILFLFLSLSYIYIIAKI